MFEVGMMVRSINSEPGTCSIGVISHIGKHEIDVVWLAGDLKNMNCKFKGKKDRWNDTSLVEYTGTVVYERGKIVSFG